MTSKIDGAMYDLHHIDALASRDTGINRIYPPVKLMVTVMYIALVMSFSKYDILQGYLAQNKSCTASDLYYRNL